MKKSLVALAVLAAAGAASAQSSVTLFGIVDAGVSYYDAKNSTTGVKNSKWAQSSSGYNTSRFGIRGTEDLGGGLAAGFWLESALQNDTGIVSSTGSATTAGARFFHRRSTVSLSGGFGEIRIGRDYTPTFWNDTVFDPFATTGVGTNVISAAHNAIVTDNQYTRADNTIGYFLPPNIGGVYGQAMYSFHENTKVSGVAGSPSKTNRYIGGRIGWTNGPLDFALAYGQTNVNNTLVFDDKVKTLNFGLSYDLGVVKLFTELSRVKTDFNPASAIPALGGDVDTKGFLVGASVPVGAGLIRASYSQAKTDFNGATADPRTRKLAVGYVHNLSKRTALYTTYAHVSNKNGSLLAPGATVSVSPDNIAFPVGTVGKSRSNGFDFGIRHQF